MEKLFSDECCCGEIGESRQTSVWLIAPLQFLQVEADTGWGHWHWRLSFAKKKNQIWWAWFLLSSPAAWNRLLSGLHNVTDINTLKQERSSCWDGRPFHLIKRWQKCGGSCAPFHGGAESPSNTKWPQLRPTSVPSGILIDPAVWPQ